MATSSGDIIRVTAKLVGPQGAIENVFQFRIEALIDSTDVGVMTDLAKKLDDAYDLLSSSLASNTVFVEVAGFNETTHQPMPTVPWPAQTVGQGVASTVAAQVAGLALLRTGISRIVGRKFIGGLVKDGFDGSGLLNSTNLLNIGAFAGSLIGEFVATSLNTYLPGVKSTKTGIFWAFIEGLARGVPATQRRRRFGRGA